MDAQVGMKVEVRYDKAWLPRTVIRIITNTERIQYHIHYSHLIMNNVYHQPLVEDVILENIRPDPSITMFPQ